MHGGRTMKEYSEAFVAFDTAKKKHAVAIADVGREGEIRYLGEIDSSPLTIERMIRKLAGRHEKLHFCYEAGPTGYGLYRQVRALGHNCSVVAPSLIPKKSGERETCCMDQPVDAVIPGPRGLIRCGRSSGVP